MSSQVILRAWQRRQKGEKSHVIIYPALFFYNNIMEVTSIDSEIPDNPQVFQGMLDKLLFFCITGKHWCFNLKGTVDPALDFWPYGKCLN